VGAAAPVAVLVTVRVAVALPGGELRTSAARPESRTALNARAIFDGEEMEIERGGDGLEGTLRGPAVWELPEATLVVPPGWSGKADDDGTIVLERAG